METFRSILCGVDFSDHSRHALRWADRLRAPGGTLTLVAAVDPLLSSAARTRFGIDLSADVEDELKEFASTTLSKGQGGMRCDVAARVGQPHELLRKVARERQADLIVLGTHGLGGFRKWLLGSTTEHVLRAARTPVFAVPLPDSPDSGEQAIDRSLDLQRIVAATDFSVPGNYAVRCAGELAHAHGAALLLMHAVTPVAVPSRWQSYVSSIEEENLSRAQARLEHLAAGVSLNGAPELVVTMGRPGDAIAFIARQHDAHLIVLGIVGEAWDMSHRPGSIAYRVLCQAHVPVLVVPPSGNPA